jgi:hypothetical protein
VRKAFASSLKARCLAEVSPKANQDNLQTMRDAPVLILVTGKWAILVSVDSYARHKGCLERLPMEMYNPRNDLPENGTLAECSELGKDYRILRYHSTLASYSQGERHDWTLETVLPMLSDMVILPRKLDEGLLKGVMASFARACRKCLSDSLVLAGEGERVNKCREVAIINK